MKANRALRTEGENADVNIAAVIGIVLLVFLVAALIGPTADQIESADENVNVSDSAVAILDLNPLFLAVLPLAAIAAIVAVAFRGS